MLPVAEFFEERLDVPGIESVKIYVVFISPTFYGRAEVSFVLLNDNVSYICDGHRDAVELFVLARISKWRMAESAGLTRASASSLSFHRGEPFTVEKLDRIENRVVADKQMSNARPIVDFAFFV